MKNRLLAVLLAALLVAVPVTYFALTPADATDVIPAYEDVMALIAQDDLVSPLLAASSTVSFTTDVFWSKANSGTTASLGTSTGHSEYYIGTSSNSTPLNCGVIVKLPSNTKSGYYSFVGFYPSVASLSSNTTVGWSSRSNACIVAPSTITLGSASKSDIVAYSSSSYASTIYVPAHTSTVYVIIAAFVDSNAFTSNYWCAGGWVQSGAFVSFAAEESLTTVTSAISSQTTSINSSVNSAQAALANAINDGFDKTVQALSSIEVSNAFSEYEDRYVENMQDQLAQIEEMLSPRNTALPNGGDIAGFVSDVQDGLGISGSSFSASAFKDATSKFGSANATGSGGPWEFFSQAVVDSLAGDTSSVGLADDDYIYAWLDEMQRRYGLWSSSSP